MSALHSVQPQPRRVRRDGGGWFVWAFGVAIVVVAGTAFVMKLVDFWITATNDGPDALGSFLIPVLNYLLVAAGFACMFLWAYFKGHFRDLEAPKYRMLEMQREFDRTETDRPATVRGK